MGPWTIWWPSDIGLDTPPRISPLRLAARFPESSSRPSTCWAKTFWCQPQLLFLGPPFQLFSVMSAPTSEGPPLCPCWRHMACTWIWGCWIFYLSPLQAYEFLRLDLYTLSFSVAIVPYGLGKGGGRCIKNMQIHVCLDVYYKYISFCITPNVFGDLDIWFPRAL